MISWRVRAGGGTSWRQMGITLFALLTHPEQFEAVKADRALIADAIEEGLRWNPTAPYFYRMVMEDVEFYGHHIPEGSVPAFRKGYAPTQNHVAVLRWRGLPEWMVAA